MYILKDVYYEVSFKYKILILLTGIVSYFFMWMCLYGKLGVLTQIKVILMNISPFSVIQAVGALFLGVVTIQFVTVMERVRNRVGWIVLGITFMTLLYFLTQSSYYELIPKSFLPILVFAFLYYMRTFISRNSWLCRYGEISFAIYLVQSPICIIANAIVPRYIETRHSITGVIVIVILICISYYVANLLNKSRLAKRFLLPRTWDEVLNSKR